MDDGFIETGFPRMPGLNEPAPDFEVMTTAGVIRLSDYQGRWLVLFAHPADFTPVCTSEIVELARQYKNFRAANCELVGLSVDSRFSHIAWLRAIQEKFGVEVPFAIIEDQTMEVARTYGMIHPGASDTTAVRAAFVIDDKGIMRAMIYYPMSIGRSVKELLRVVQALQVADQSGVVLPEGWKPGDEAVECPPETVTEASRRSIDGSQSIDWYYSKRQLVKGAKKS